MKTITHNHALAPRRDEHSSTLKNTGAKGFAIIAVLTLMVLLLILAIGLLSISTVAIRNSSHDGDIRKARANARLALTMAICELQKTAGADTRVTAPADALADSDGPPQLTGVWRSWEGNDHDKTTGLPIKPDYDSKSQRYGSGSGGRFLTWLVSGENTESSPTSPPDLQKGDNTVPLLAEGSLGTGTSGEVHLTPTNIDDSGAYAWWIQGKNSKAFIKQPDPDPTKDEEWSRRLASHGLANPEAFGFDAPEDLKRMVSQKSFDLVSNRSPENHISAKYFRDITSFSHGLLTNTANGGWRRDLSLMAEKWSQGTLPTNGLPVFSPEPFSEESERSLRLSDDSSNASIYPWVTADNIAMSWHALMDFVSLYKKVQTNSSSGEPYFKVAPAADSDWISIEPVFARVHWAFGYDATKNGEQYTPRLLIKPSVTMWNPYNVAIESNRVSLLHLADNAFPINLYAQVGEQEAELDIGALLGNRVTSNRGRYQMSDSKCADQTWKPGESRMFGKPGITGQSTNWNWLAMDPGFSIDGSMKIALSKGSGIAPGAGSDKFSYRWDHKNDASNNVTAQVDYFWSRNIDTADEDDLRNKSCDYKLTTPFSSAEEKLPLPDLVNDNQTLASAFEEDSPFLVVTIGLRTLMNEYLDDPSAPAKVHTKGYINTKQIVPGVDLLGGVSAEDSPYAWEIYAPNSWEDPFMPQSDDAVSYGKDHSSYVGTSFQAGMGLNRWSIAELPTQPLLSLGELQHFDISFKNRYPPRVANAIGNSHATPHIASDQVLDDRGEGSGRVARHDHSYVSNHVLFDDWFVSSITPDVEAFTQNEKRSIEQVYADHLSMETPLRNKRYLPANPLRASEAEDAAVEVLSDEMAWHDIASEIEVEGMFNINSTSVQAWKAVLMNQRDAQVPQTSVGAGSADAWSTDLADSPDTVVSRTTVAGDPLSAGDPAIAKLATFTTMTDDEVGALAGEIVEQIKKRGPFLSLSEFVNRRLDNDDDLAMAGAIEAALMTLAESDSNNPFEEIQSAFPQQATLPSDASLIYKYSKAAEGYAAYGTPGWPRQADILRPLAPIISARDDTFVIRAYGDAKNAATGKVAASAWCEAVVQRKAEYVDSQDAPTEFADLQSDLNEEFGRRFVIVSFRWLSADEI